MLINDFSQQDFLTKETNKSSYLAEVVMAGAIFVFPIVLLIIISS